MAANNGKSAVGTGGVLVQTTITLRNFSELALSVQ